MTTGYEDWTREDLERFIIKEQDELRQLNQAVYAREWTLRRALWELEKRLKRPAP